MERIIGDSNTRGLAAVSRENVKIEAFGGKGWKDIEFILKNVEKFNEGEIVTINLGLIDCLNLKEIKKEDLKEQFNVFGNWIIEKKLNKVKLSGVIDLPDKSFENENKKGIFKSNRKTMNEMLKRLKDDLAQYNIATEFVSHDENFTFKNDKVDASIFRDEVHLNLEGLKRMGENLKIMKSISDIPPIIPAPEFSGEFTLPWGKWDEIYNEIDKTLEEDECIEQLIQYKNIWLVEINSEKGMKRLFERGFSIGEQNIDVFEKGKKCLKYRMLGIPKQCSDSVIVQAFKQHGIPMDTGNIERGKYPGTPCLNGEITVKIEERFKERVPGRIDIAMNLRGIAISGINTGTPFKKNMTWKRNTGNNAEKGNKTRPQPECYICKGDLGSHEVEDCPRARPCMRCQSKRHLTWRCRAEYLAENTGTGTRENDGDGTEKELENGEAESQQISVVPGQSKKDNQPKGPCDDQQPRRRSVSRPRRNVTRGKDSDTEKDSGNKETGDDFTLVKKPPKTRGREQKKSTGK